MAQAVLAQDSVRLKAMKIAVLLSTLGGRSHRVEVDIESACRDLRDGARRIFGRPAHKLISDGSILWPRQGVTDVPSLRENSVVQVVWVRGRIYRNGAVFAVVKGDGSVVTWGNENHGGDSSDAQEQLAGIQHIYSTFAAFAAVKADGSVVTWGYQNHGGDSSDVQEQLADEDLRSGDG